jgi:hypothetical protein
MILILAQAGTEEVAGQIAAALGDEYKLPSAPEVLAANALGNRSAEWDDLLLVIFNSRTLPDPAVQFIQAYSQAHETGAAIIPIAANPAFQTPPFPISEIKGTRFDGSAQMTERIVKAAGVFLGLALRPGSQKIFVSYRASDGKQLAQAIFARLQGDGFQPWLDEAGESLAIGDRVQEKIAKGVESAAMVLLVDTPDAPASKWVSIEMDLAIGQLIPVLPVVAGGERISRFIQLQGLRRQALVKQNGLDGTPVSDGEWQSVRQEVDELLLSAFRRRLRILSRARGTFEENGYRWQVVDERLRMYRAEKKTPLLAQVLVFSHCLVHDVTYVPALRAYWNYLRRYPDVAKLNQKLCIYDRDKVLSDTEIETLSVNLPDMNAILAHYNELDLLVASNFTALR